MVLEHNTLMQELQELSVCLSEHNTLVLKQNGLVLECEFSKGGLYRQQVQVTDQFLAVALRQESVLDILEGSNYSIFKNNFSHFALRVKAKRLYFQLSSQPILSEVTTHKLLVA